MAGLHPDWAERIERAKESPLAFIENLIYSDEGVQFVPNYGQRMVLTSTTKETWCCLHRRLGKTALLAALIHDCMFRYPGCRIGLYCPSSLQRDEVFQGYDKYMRCSPILQQFKGEINNNDNPVTRTYFNGSRVEGHVFGLTEDDAVIDAKRGGTYDIIFCDEVQSFVEKVWSVLSPIISGNNYSKPWMRVWCFGTFIKPTGMFYKTVAEDGEIPGYRTIIYLPIDKNPEYSLEDIELRKLTHTKEQFETEWLLKPTTISDDVFRLEDVEAAFTGDYFYGTEMIRQGQFRVIGVDWDKVQAGTTIVVAQFNPNHNHWTVINREVIPKGDFTLTNGVKRIYELVDEYDAHMVSVDQGYGETNYELLKEWALTKRPEWFERIIQVKLGGKVEIPDIDHPGEIVKKDTKGYMVELTRSWFENKSITFPKTDKDAAGQFFKYKVKKIVNGRKTYTSENEHIIDALGFIFMAHNFYYEEFKYLIFPRIIPNPPDYAHLQIETGHTYRPLGDFSYEDDGFNFGEKETF